MWGRQVMRRPGGGGVAAQTCTSLARGSRGETQKACRGPRHGNISKAARLSNVQGSCVEDLYE